MPNRLRRIIVMATAAVLVSSAPAHALIKGGPDVKRSCPENGAYYADGTVITMTIKHPDGTTSTVKKRCNDGTWESVRTDATDTVVADPASLGPILP